MCETVGFIPLTHNDPSTDLGDNPYLILRSFAEKASLNFGEVKRGHTKVKCLTIENPNEDEAIVTTVKFPPTKSFLLHGYGADDSKNRVYKVPPNSVIDVNIAWTPSEKEGNAEGNVRYSMEMKMDNKRFMVVISGTVIDVKQRKGRGHKNPVRALKKKATKPLEVSFGLDENNTDLRFKGVANHTAMVLSKSVVVPLKKTTKVLGENQNTNIMKTTSVVVDKEPIKPIRLPLQPQPDKENEPEHKTLIEAPSDPEIEVSAAFTPLMTLPIKLDPVESPFNNLDTPRTRKRLVSRSVQRVCKRHKRLEWFSMLSECVDKVPRTPTPLLVGVLEANLPPGAPSSGSSGGGTTPRKRRTWGAPDIHPLINSPTVVTRAALKRIGENSMCQQTFMECHTMGPSILEQTSPPRSRDIDKPMSPLPTPFSPPGKVAVAVPVLVSPEDRVVGRTSGPLTATPLHPSMALKIENKEDNLPCFDTSIIPHLATGSPRMSDLFRVPAINTTTSTVNSTQDENVAPPALSGPTTSTPSPASSNPITSTPVIRQANKQVAQKPALVQRSALKSSSSASNRPTKKPEVQFRKPMIKSGAGPSITRAKTAPGLARREGLKKNMTFDAQRVIKHPTKRRSVSASRAAEVTPKSADLDFKPPKRKDLVTPKMDQDQKSPTKRPRPLLRVASADETFREKRQKASDVTRAAGRVSRRSMVPPASTGKRVKMQPKRMSTALPRHPLALCGASNIYFDARWKCKQERSFTVWMNYYLASPSGALPPEYQNTRAITKHAAGKLRKSVAPPDNAKILIKLQAERKLLHAERRACAIFQSAEKVILKLEREINEGGLTIRNDRKLDADLGLKDQLIDLMLCYNPIWLRLGLEVLFEEILPLSEHKDMVGMLAFLNTRFVNNPVIAQKYAHPTVPGCHGAGFEQELQRFTLRKFMMLVLLLDMAKTARVIEHDPCLFCLKSPHKSSRSLLISFSNAYLGGEGSITKHLGYIGYVVQHEQKHIDEFDYPIKKIEVDLRDGIRLTRLVEVITETPLTDKLRTPTVSRLQKMHNVGVMLAQLQEEGVDLEKVPHGPITSKTVVDGNQELTLSLIWRIIFQYCIVKILAVEQLKQEIKILKEIRLRKKQVQHSDQADEEDFVLGLPERRLSMDERQFFHSEVLQTLLEWCKVVCSYYDVPVENFTTSLSDGRVLCLLIHHYHPQLVPFHKINMETSLSRQLLELNESRDFLSKSLLDPELHREREKENFKTLSEALKGLNEVPAMIFSQDMLGTIPDEKVGITFIAYLCASLVDISQDFRAAQKIQRCWRRCRFLGQQEAMREKRKQIIKLQALLRRKVAKGRLEELKLNREAIIAQRRNFAASQLQNNWRRYIATKEPRADFKLKRKAAITIQKHYKAILAERWKHRISAATMIQKTWRGFRDQRKFQTYKSSAVVIQSVYRMHRCRQEFLRSKASVKLISEFWLTSKKTHQLRSEFLAKRSAALNIQSYLRGYLVRRDMARTKSAILIQSYLRGYLVRRDIARTRAAIMIQSLYRGYQARVRVQHLREHRALVRKQIRSAVVIQSHVRGLLVRRELEARRTAAVKIAGFYRNYLLMKTCREEFLDTRHKVVLVQSCVRGFIARRHYLATRDSIVKIQSVMRGCLCRKGLQKKHQSATFIQQVFRSYLQMKTEREAFEDKRRAAVKIQSTWKMVQAVRLYQLKSRSATQIQSTWRMYRVRSAYQTHQRSAAIIQRAWRTYRYREIMRDQKIKVLRAVLVIQAHHRGMVLRSGLARQHSSALQIQAVYRGYTVRRHVAHQHSCARAIQTHYRGYRAMLRDRACYLEMRTSAVVIQSHVRAFLVRRAIQRQTAAVIKIQSAFRCHQAYQHFTLQRQAAVLIQSHVRAWQCGREQRKQYLEQRAAVLTLQSIYRGVTVRRDIARQHTAATKIQASWRMFRVRVGYLAERGAAVTIQATWRMVTQRRDFRRTVNSAVMIQSAVRMFLQVTKFRSQRRAAISIQSHWRGFVSKTQFQRKVRASVVIQARWRGYVAQQKIMFMRSLRSKILNNSVSLTQVKALKALLSGR